MSKTLWGGLKLDEYKLLKSSSKKKSVVLDNWTKTDVLMTNQIIEEVFTSETPMDVIDGAANYLDSQSIVKGYADTRSTVGNLFDFE